MPTFLWKGRTLAGESQAGEIEVARQEDVIEFLRKKRILVTSVRPKAGGLQLPKFGGVFSDGFHVLLADGAALFVRQNTAEKNIRAAITRAGGEKERIGD